MTIAILIIAGIGLVSAIVLAIADKYLSVREDPRIGLVTAALPGANCGGCGFAGCDGYAHALVAGTAPNGACAAGGAACAAAIAKILGVEATATERRVALVKCCGTRAETIRVGDYNGICDCGVAAATAGGDKGCAYGCLGYGACANVCPQHAIRVVDGLAKVEKRLCIGCGKCVAVCPRRLIELVPASATIHVLCANPDKGPAVRKVCGVGCMGCHLCEKNSGGKEANHFTFQGFLAKVNYANPPTDEQIAAKCPAKCMSVDPHAAHAAFTLVELLIVIAIIGILAGVLLSTFSGGSDSARAARCLSNMKNLANACQTYGMKTGNYPGAGSVVEMTATFTQGRRNAKVEYTERPGWISWDSEGNKHSSSSSPLVSMYCEDTAKANHALTNGCIWAYVSKNRETYVCPTHAKSSKTSTRPVWSYLMNGYFGWDDGGEPVSTDDKKIWCSDSGVRADRRLLFAEVPFTSYSPWLPEGSGSSTETDAVLQYNSGDLSEGDASRPTKSGEETIGVNHPQGKNLFAHVVYADGHVEKLRIPFTGSIKNPSIDSSALKQLTTWLCAGKDLSFDGKNYTNISGTLTE